MRRDKKMPSNTSITTSTEQDQETICNTLFRKLTDCLMIFGHFAVPYEYPYYRPGDKRGLPELAIAPASCLIELKDHTTNTPG